MADITARVTAGEVLKLYHAAKVDPYKQRAETPPGLPLTQVTADANGLATFPAVTPRVEYVAMRPDGRFITVMDGRSSGASGGP